MAGKQYGYRWNASFAFVVATMLATAFFSQTALSRDSDRLSRLRDSETSHQLKLRIRKDVQRLREAYPRNSPESEARFLKDMGRSLESFRKRVHVDILPRLTPDELDQIWAQVRRDVYSVSRSESQREQIRSLDLSPVTSERKLATYLERRSVQTIRQSWARQIAQAGGLENFLNRLEKSALLKAAAYVSNPNDDSDQKQPTSLYFRFYGGTVDLVREAKEYNLLSLLVLFPLSFAWDTVTLPVVAVWNLIILGLSQFDPTLAGRLPEEEIDLDPDPIPFDG